jgi:hypothetical protein
VGDELLEIGLSVADEASDVEERDVALLRQPAHGLDMDLQKLCHLLGREEETFGHRLRLALGTAAAQSHTPASSGDREIPVAIDHARS